MTVSRTLRLACPAKVNLALSVGRARPDGMHAIASWMAALRFADELTLTCADDERSEFDLAPTNDPGDPPVIIDWSAEQDLTTRAHRLLQEHTGRTLPVRLSLRKHIPARAGLGGGSADAALTLVGLDRLYDLQMESDELLSLGLTLGSDVPFLIQAALGEPSCLVTGVGDQLEPLPRRRPTHIVLMFPDAGCDTGAVYGAFDRANPPISDTKFAGPDVDRVRAVAQHDPLPADAPFNDLADPALAVSPPLGEALETASDRLGYPIHVSGSGSTLFLITPTAAEAASLAEQATELTGMPAIATETL